MPVNAYAFNTHNAINDNDTPKIGLQPITVTS